MAKDKEPDELHPKLQEVYDNLNNFIENINCLQETFDLSEVNLRIQQDKANKEYNDFVKRYTINGEDGEPTLQIPDSQIRIYNKLERRLRRAQKSVTLIPPSYIVTLVSLFDSFFSGLVRCVYSLCPNKLNESQKSITYKDICDYRSIQEIRKMLIDSVIEDLLRDSHDKQFSWLAKAFDLDTVKKFDGWSQFVELTERRNLFVHSDGIVSLQYLSVCKDHKVSVAGISLGQKLAADSVYFNESYKLVYRMAIQLTQILINRLYIGTYTNDTSDRDKVLINNVYELISEEHYDIAIAVSNFALDKCYHRNGKDRGFIILNLAQAHKWSGNNDKCLEILDDEDTSMWNDDLTVPKLCLQDKFDEAYPLIEKVGTSSEVLTTKAYREWPIFRALREQDDFTKLFNAVFNEDLKISHTINVTDALNAKDDVATVAEPS